MARTSCTNLFGGFALLPAFVLDGKMDGVVGEPSTLEAAFPLLARERGDRFDSLSFVVVALLQAFWPGRFENPDQPRAAHMVYRLRHRMVVAFSCAVLSVPPAMWLLVRGFAAYIATEGDDRCSKLRVWLVGFLILQLSWPICMPSLTLLLLGWCLSALALDVPGCPILESFVVEASALQLVQVMLLLVAAATGIATRPLIIRLSELLAHQGSDPEILDLIPVLEPDAMNEKEECSICLSSEHVRWSLLPCGHTFHQPCLFRWLARSRRCPFCRCDVPDAYKDHFRV